jgi:protein O-mannosyl-transferase
MPTSQRRKGDTLLACLILGLGTVWLYAPVVGFDFINLDDTLYVVNNFHVNNGLNLKELPWYFQAGHAGNWHPLTWISHALDCQFFGLKPGGPHFINSAIHAINSVLVFIFLSRASGAFWRSFVVAALFAWHPLHVESVAWISERKDVLSTLFWMLSLLAWLRYVKNRQSTSSRFDYVGALLLFTCGLMSKPMVVTLPFVLLLLDWWPLNRLRFGGAGAPSPADSSSPETSSLASLIVEKIPFFVLSLGCCLLTVIAQRRGAAVSSLSDLPFQYRVVNAVVSSFRYLEKIVWPVNLSIIYPFSISWPAWEVAAAIITLLAIIVFAVWQALRRGYLPTGWFWFLGTLVPVIGLVQVGLQSMADRYTYIPSIGIFIVVCWGAYDLVKNWRYHQLCLSLGTVGVLAACIATSSRQIQCWKNSGTLFAHAIAVTKDNYYARVNLASYLTSIGQAKAAVNQAEEAVRINPNDPTTHAALGQALLAEGKPGPAADELRKALAIQYIPGDAVQLAMALAQEGKTSDAIAQYRKVLETNPNQPDALNNLAWILAASSQPEFRNGPEAVQLAERACAVTHDRQPLMIGTLADAYAEAGRFDDAVAAAQRAHDVAVGQDKTTVAARNLELLEEYRSHRAYHEKQ